MLRQLFNSLIRPNRQAPDTAPSEVSFPIEDLHELKDRHERAPLDLHSRILFGETTIAGHNLLELYDACMRETGTVVSSWKKLARIQGAANLARYFLHTLELTGARAECGVFQGFSALFACRAAAGLARGFDGTGFYLVDSFAGFPKPRAEDFIPMRSAPIYATRQHSTKATPPFPSSRSALLSATSRRTFRTRLYSGCTVTAA